jgi:hypothetical protein
MTHQEGGNTSGLNLTDPKARRALAQVYMLLLDLANESDAPTEPDETRHDDTQDCDQEQAQCPA